MNISQTWKLGGTIFSHSCGSLITATLLTRVRLIVS
jgi:hypothetical protein